MRQNGGSIQPIKYRESNLLEERENFDNKKRYQLAAEIGIRYSWPEPSKYCHEYAAQALPAKEIICVQEVVTHFI